MSIYNLEVISKGIYLDRKVDADRFEINDKVISFFINTAPPNAMPSFALLCAYGTGKWRAFAPADLPKRFIDTPKDAP